jgi:hypothetical protein
MIFLEVIHPNLVAALQEITSNPATDAPITARQKNTHWQATVNKASRSVSARRIEEEFEQEGTEKTERTED